MVAYITYGCMLKYDDDDDDIDDDDDDYFMQNIELWYGGLSNLWLRAKGRFRWIFVMKKLAEPQTRCRPTFIQTAHLSLELYQYLRKYEQQVKASIK